MPFTYQPLQGNDIRVLTLHPVTNDADVLSPITCTLEHVDLPPGHDVDRETHAYKGSNYVWPELLTLPDFSPLFRSRSSRRRLTSQLPTSSKSSNDHDDDELPWRRTWGDFVALSYAWGPETPQSFIMLNGEPFQIRPNLHDALVRLRSGARIRQGFKLWIDSICINQADTAERSQQLSRMRDIYASAWQVITWLGPARGDSDLAVAALRWIAARNRPLYHSKTFYRRRLVVDAPVLRFDVALHPRLRRRVYKALGKFFLRQYWRRLWILQEVAIARADAPIACGQLWLTWDMLRTATTFMVQDEERFGTQIVRYLHPIPTSEFEAGRNRLAWERCWASERMWRLVLELTNLQQDQRALSNTTDAPATDFIRPLLLGLEAQAELAEDRVYGLLAMKAIADRTAMTPTYGSPLQDIYKDFSLQLLSKGDLNVLQLVSRHSVDIYRDLHAAYIEDNPYMPEAPFFAVTISFETSLRPDVGRGSRPVGSLCVHSLPSWTICMICRPIPTARLKGLYRAGGPRPSHIFAKMVSNNGLLVQGILLDVITSLGACHVREVDENYPTTPPGGLQLNANAYRDLEGARTALCRTILADTTAQGGASDAKNVEVLLNGRMWRKGFSKISARDFCFRRVMSRNRGLVLSGYTLDELILPDLGQKDYVQKRCESKENREAIYWAVNVMAWRRFMSTKAGRMGLAPAGARLGDVVAILMGCDMPLILRRQEKGGWIVVGESYVHGVMYGEEIRDRDNFDDITLY